MRAFGRQLSSAVRRYSIGPIGRGRGRGSGALPRPIGAARGEDPPPPVPSPVVGTDEEIARLPDGARGRGRGRRGVEETQSETTAALHEAVPISPSELQPPPRAVIPSASSKTLSVMILAYITAGQMEKVEDILNRLQQNGILPEPVALNGADAALARTGKVGAVEQLLQEAERERVEVDITALSALVELYAGVGDITKMEVAAALLEERGRDSTTAPETAEATGLVEGAQGIFEDPEEEQADGSEVGLTADERQAIRHRMMVRGGIGVSQRKATSEGDSPLSRGEEEEEEETEEAAAIVLSQPPPPPQQLEEMVIEASKETIAAEEQAEVLMSHQVESVQEGEGQAGVEVEGEVDIGGGRPQPLLSGKSGREGLVPRAGRGTAMPSPVPGPSLENPKRRPPIGAPIVGGAERGAGRGSIQESKRAEPLNREEARARALSVMSAGVTRQQERSRRASMDEYSMGLRVPRRQDGESSEGPARERRQPRGPPAGRPAQPQPYRPRMGQKEWVQSPSDDVNLSPEAQRFYDAALFERDLEDSIGRQLHSHFSVHFEPEYLIDTAGTNPDLSEAPPPSLEEYMNSAKAFLVTECGIQSEEQWKEHRDRVVGRGPALEMLVERYTGARQMSAVQQKEALRAIADNIPESAGLAAKAFVQRSLGTLQTNPSYSYMQKVDMLTRLTNTLSASQ